MATSKPRITITLNQGVYDTLHDLAEIQGCSMSSIVSDLLETVDPVQKKVLAAMRRVRTIKKGTGQDLVSSLERGHEEVQTSMLPLFDMLDQLGSQPPHSNTGVRSCSSLPQNPEKTAVSPDSKGSGGDS